MLNKEEAIRNLNAACSAFGAITIHSSAASTRCTKMIADKLCADISDWEIGVRIPQYRQKLEDTLSWIKPLEDKFLKKEGENV